MRHLALAISFLVLASAVSSCGGERARGLLVFADSLLEDCPDSARAVLVRDSSLICRAGRAGRMWYALSRTEADDKCYVTHTSDSAILAAASYYSGRGEPLPEARAWYLLGRVYCDMHFYGSALSAFDNALKVVAGGDTAVCRYQSRACTWAAFVYEEKKLYGKALYYNKKAYQYAKKSGMPSLEVYSLRDIGRDYSLLKKNRMAISYYERAAIIAESRNYGYLYNMVQDELAAVYMEEGLLDKAFEALDSPLRRTLDENKALHYFSWGMFYQKKNMPDSAILYFKKNLEYGNAGTRSETSLTMARLYRKYGQYDDAADYYESHLDYEKVLTDGQVSEYNDYIRHIERNLENERMNVRLVKTRTGLIMLIFLIIIFSLFLALFFVRLYNKRKRFYEVQKERINMYWKRRSEHDFFNILKNEARIRSLERELSHSKDILTDLRKELMRNEVMVLQMKNSQLRFERRHRELLMADLADTDVYKFFHNPTSKPTANDFHRLAEVLNVAYSDFTYRLKDVCPDISVNEMRICCMVKAGLSPKDICGLTDTYFSYVNMVKTRLYKKIFNKKGSAKDLDKFIVEF